MLQRSGAASHQGVSKPIATREAARQTVVVFARLSESAGSVPLSLGVPMIRKLSILLAVLSLVALMLPAAVVARSDRARLIDVHVTRAMPARPGGGANCSNDGTSNNLYTLTGWVVQSNKTAHLNTSTVPSGLSNVPSAMQAGFDAWRGVEANAPQINVATDGTITKQTANHSYDLMFGRAGGNTIAVTYTWQWNTGEIESDTVFNNRLPWFTASSEGDGCYENQAAYDVRNIATHEFGHTYGLGHPGDDRFETMYAYGFTGETLKWSPENGDDTGISGLY